MESENRHMMTRTIYKFEVHRERVKVSEEPLAPIRDSRCVADVARRVMGPIDHEMMLVLHVDTKTKIRGVHVAGVGGRTSCTADPIEIFRAAVIAGSTALVLVHNHPSGDPSPSAEDMAVTARLVQGAQLLGIRILDHVILGDERHFSMLDAGLMPMPRTGVAA